MIYTGVHRCIYVCIYFYMHIYAYIWIDACVYKPTYTWVTCRIYTRQMHISVNHARRCAYPYVCICMGARILRARFTRRCMVVRTRHIYPSTPKPEHIRLESILIFFSFFCVLFIEKWVDFNGLELFYCFTPETVNGHFLFILFLYFKFFFFLSNILTAMGSN